MTPLGVRSILSAAVHGSLCRQTTQLQKLQPTERSLQNFVSINLKIGTSLFRGVLVHKHLSLQRPGKEKDSKSLTCHSRLAHYEQKQQQLMTG